MAKKYRLKYNIGKALEGAIGTINHRQDHYYFEVEDGQDLWFPKEFVEDNPRTFEEIKEKERVLVTNIKSWDNGENIIQISTTRKVDTTFIPSIVNSLESILNNEQPKEDSQEKINADCVHQFMEQPDNHPLTGEFITKEECERREKEINDSWMEMMESQTILQEAREMAAFNAGAAFNNKFPFEKKYSTYEDYQQFGQNPLEKQTT